MAEASCTAGRIAKCEGNAQAAATHFWDFLPQNAEACLNKVNATYGKLNRGAVALSAADYQAMSAVCNNVYRGTGLANEGSCVYDADCLDGLICDKTYCGTAKMVGQGDQCADIGEICPQGYSCSNASGVWLCASKVDLGGACAASPCLESLRCLGGVCVAQLGIGEDCAVDQDCSSGFCEPYAFKCAQDVRFANGNPDCLAMGGT
jgi:hypothetical protein